MSNLQASLRQFRPLLLGMWSKRRSTLFIFGVICLIGWLAAAFIPNKYESSTKVFADTKSLLRPLLEGIAVHGDTDEEVRIMAQNLLSRPNLEMIARQSGLYLLYPTPESYEVFLMNFQKQIEIVGSKKQNLFTITYTHSDPKTAKKVVELTLQKFVDATVGQSRVDNDTATVFLTGQIIEQKTKLETAERALAEFKQEYQQILPQRGVSYMQDINILRQQLEDTELEIEQKIAQLDSLQNSVHGMPSGATIEGSVEDVRSNQIKTPLDAKIAQLEDGLVNLRIRYTDKHPDIIEIESILSELRPAQRELQKSILENASQGMLVANDSQDRSSLHDASIIVMQIRSELGSLEAKRETVKKRLADRLSILDTIPDIEAKLTGLTRDYDTIRELYLSLLQRRDSAELSRNMNENTNEVKFRVIEPPTEPLIASGTPRSIVYVVVFVLSFLIALLYAFTSSQLQAVIRGSEHLSTLVRKQVAACIPDMSYSSKGKWLSFFMFVGSILFLFSLLIGLILHEVMTGQSPIFWIKG